MKTLNRILIGVLAISLLGLAAVAESNDSILVIHPNGKNHAQKAGGHLDGIETGIQGQSIERMTYRQFTILLNPLSNGEYELLAYRWVVYGSRRVNSTFSSVFKSSVEYSYAYDPSAQAIVQYHFLFPPNSLTGWATPGDYAIIKQLAWGENLPSKTCSTPVYTLEEFGREYLQAGCFQERDSALRFAKKFIDYVWGARGL